MEPPTANLRLFHGGSWSITQPLQGQADCLVHISLRETTQYRSAEFFVINDRTAPTFCATFRVPLDVLRSPWVRDRYVFNQLLRQRQSFIGFYSNHLTPLIGCFASRLARGIGPNHGFLIEAELEIITEQFVYQTELLHEFEAALAEWAALERGELPDLVEMGASKSAIEGLKKEKFEGGDEATCAICLEDLSTGTEFTRMPCSRLFHYGCIIKWMTKSNTCPVCRFVIPIH